VRPLKLRRKQNVTEQNVEKYEPVSHCVPRGRTPCPSPRPRRISGLAPRAVVQFSDVNGPRGGVGKCSRIELRTGAERRLRRRPVDSQR